MVAETTLHEVWCMANEEGRLMFILGLFIGGFIGMMLMCMLNISGEHNCGCTPQDDAMPLEEEQGWGSK